MEYYLNQFTNIFNNIKDIGVNLFSGSGVSIQAYHLRKDTSVLERNDTEELVNGNHVITYLVISGCAEFRIDEECIRVNAGSMITIYLDNNFTVWAIEDTDMFSIHNCVEPDIDNTPQELVSYIHQLELQDLYLQGHNYRVGKYSTLIMQAIAPKKSTVKYHFVAAYHDVGKIDVPSEILNKNGKLTKEEFDEIKKHPVSSFTILKQYLGEKAANYARWHHEKLDGSGYPDGLQGDEIPLESRVMAVADIFDALTTSRCYRTAFSFEKALSIIKEDVDAGKLDARAYDALVRMIESGVIQEGIDNQLKSDTD